MFFNKWVTFTAGFYLQLCGGICYTFGLYSNDLKLRFNLDQTALQGIGTALLASGLLGWVPGLVYDSLRKYPRAGPRVTAYLGTTCHFVAYICIYLAAKGTIYIPYAGIITLAIIAGSNIVWMDNACIATSIRNFPNSRGHIAGIHKAFLGLSASVCSSVYAAVFVDTDLSPIDFILFLALMPVALCLLFTPLLNFVPYKEVAELESHQRICGTGARFGTGYAVVGGLAAYQLAVAITNVVYPLSHTERVGTLIGTLILVAACAIVPVGAGSVFSRPVWSLVEVAGSEAGAPLLAEEEAGEKEGLEKYVVEPASVKELDQEELDEAEEAVAEWVAPELNIFQCLLSLQFWLLFWGLAVGMGAGFTFLNNIGQFTLAVGGSPATSAVMVSLFSIFSCAGRMAYGFGTEHMLHTYGTARTLFFVVNSFLAACISAFTAFANLQMMYVSAVVGGFVFGGFWSLMPLQTSELFGLKYFASNNSVMYLSPTIGSFVFATTMAGQLYSKTALEQTADIATCNGQDCFEDAFLILSGLNLANTAWSAVNWWRTRAHYRNVFLALQRKDTM